jgi:hypothetical protein
MIAHRGNISDRLTLLLALDRTDIGRLLTGTPVIFKRYTDSELFRTLTHFGPDIVLHFVESPQEAARYANELLTEGEKI